MTASPILQRLPIMRKIILLAIATYVWKRISARPAPVGGDLR